MTLVKYAVQLADVSDRAGRDIGGIRVRDGTSLTDLATQLNAIWMLSESGNVRVPGMMPMVHDQSTISKVKGDMGGYAYQKPALPYSRRAPRRILLYDDFEGATLKWVSTAGTLTRDTTAGGVFAPTGTLKGVTGAVAGNLSDGSQKRGYQGLQKYVLETWWAMSAAASTTPRRFQFFLLLRDGANIHQLNVAYLKNLTTPQNKWQFSGDGSAWTDVTGGAETIDVDAAVPYSWHYLRLHLDFSIATPQLNELHTDILDLTGLTHAGSSATATTARSSTGGFQIDTDAAAASTMLVGYVNLSQNEA